MNRHNAKRAFFGACAAFAALLIPTAAVAEEKPADATPSDEAEAKDAAPKRLSLRSGANFVTGTVGGSTITRGSLSAGAGYDVLPRLTVYADLGLETTRLAYDGAMDDGLHVRASMWSYAGMSAETGFNVKLLRLKPFALDAHAAFETSIVGTKPSVTGVRAETAQGAFDVTPYAEKQTETDFRWNRFSVGTTFRLEIGRVSPSLGVSFERIDASMDLHLTEDSRQTITRLGYDPQQIEGRHRLTYYMVPITPGIEFTLAKDVRLGAHGMFAPAGDGMFWGGGAHLNVALF
jgi:hypothetical protein